jgi:hypothetical protein
MKEERIVEQLGKMVASGRITAEEADRIRAAAGTPAFEESIAAVRARHASVHLASAVADGEMTTAEADEHLRRLRDGEHPKGLRARLRTHRKSSSGDGAISEA